MTQVFDLIRAEPVRLVAAIQATLALLVLFGLPLTAEQLSGVALAIGAWLAFVTRQAVTPLHAP